MSEITRLLSAIEQGDPHAAEQLLSLVYDELRRLGARRIVTRRPEFSFFFSEGMSIIGPWRR